MNKSTLSVGLSVVYFIMATVAVVNFQPAHWLVGIFSPILVAACYCVTMFGIAALIHPESKTVSGTTCLSPGAAKSVRFVGFLLTLPLILYLLCGEILVRPFGSPSVWRSCVETFAGLKGNLEVPARKESYLHRVAHFAAESGLKAEKEGNLKEAYEHYSNYNKFHKF